MYICVISRGYPSDAYKMNGIFEYDQAKALAGAGMKVVMAVVDLRSFRRKRKWGLEHFTRDGVEIYAMNVPVGRCPSGLLHWFGVRALRRLAKIIEKEQGRPDILHSHFTDISRIAADWAQRERIPLIVTEHNSKMNEQEVPPSLRKTARQAYACADRVIAVGSGLAANIRRLTGVEAVVIGNVVDAGPFAKGRSTEAAGSPFRFVSTGRLVPGKRIGLLLQAFAVFSASHPEVRLDIFGDGPLRPELNQYIAEHGLEGCVALKGMCSREQMAAAYQESAAFVLPSRRETFGVAYIEAMAAGLPVIATRCLGPEDFVTPENGLLIPVDDKDALVNAMEYMYAHAASYDRRKISDDIIRRFSPETIAGQLESLYQTVRKEKNEEGEGPH